MKKLLRTLSVLILGAALAAPAAWAQRVHVDFDFEGNDYDVPEAPGTIWTVGKGESPDDWDLWETDPDGKTNTSLWTKGADLQTKYDSNYANLELAGSDEDPLIWQFDFYDFNEDPGASVDSAAYTALRRIHGDAAWQATIFAFGVWEGSSRSNYSIRIYPTHNWVTLDVERTEGWHTVSFVITTDIVRVYFDEDLYDATAVPVYENSYGFHVSAEDYRVLDTIQVGGDASNAQEGFLWDNIYIANDEALKPEVFISEDPSPRFTWRHYDEEISYSVTVGTGIEPFSYQWTLDNEPLEDNDRISGSQTDTLTISATRPEDSGKYRVIVTDATETSTVSKSAELMALEEHEVLMNAVDLPEEAIQPSPGSFTRLDSGWYGAYYATQREPDPEQDEQSVTFQPEITKTGHYLIQTWFPPSYPGGNRTQEAAYIIHHAEGEDTVLINQQVEGIAEFWHDVGTFKFEEGSEGYVKISNLFEGSARPSEHGQENWLVLSDAVRFIPVEAPPSDGEAPAIAISRTESGDIELFISGEPETTYTIESVDNLGDEWSELGTETTDPSGDAVFTDPSAEETARRFYRVVSP